MWYKFISINLGLSCPLSYNTKISDIVEYSKLFKS